MLWCLLHYDACDAPLTHSWQLLRSGNIGQISFMHLQSAPTCLQAACSNIFLLLIGGELDCKQTVRWNRIQATCMTGRVDILQTHAALCSYYPFSKRLDKVLWSPSTLGVAGNTEERYNLWFHTEITPYSAETHEQYRQASYWSDWVASI